MKAGIVKDKQRFKCEKCSYYSRVNKAGKQIDTYYVNKALQLYFEGLSYRESNSRTKATYTSIRSLSEILIDHDDVDLDTKIIFS